MKMPQQDKEITEILGIPRLTLHSWKTGNSHTKLLYAILKRMSATELKSKKADAEEFFNLLVISREDLYQRLYHHESLRRPLDGYADVKLIKNINIANKDDMACIIEPTDKNQSLIVHYIVKGSHNKTTAKAFIKKIQDIFSDEDGVNFDGVTIHLYGTDLKEDVYVAHAMSGRMIKTHNINEVLGIDKELVITSNMQ